MAVGFMGWGKGRTEDGHGQSAGVLIKCVSAARDTWGLGPIGDLMFFEDSLPTPEMGTGLSCPASQSHHLLVSAWG